RGAPGFAEVFRGPRWLQHGLVKRNVQELTDPANNAFRVHQQILVADFHVILTKSRTVGSCPRNIVRPPLRRAKDVFSPSAIDREAIVPDVPDDVEKPGIRIQALE